MFLPLLFNHYFSDFSNPPKTKKNHRVPFQVPQPPPKKIGPVFLTKGAFGTSPLRLCLGSTLQCPCAATLGVKGGGRSNVAAGRGTPCGAKVGWDVDRDMCFFYLKMAGKEMWFLKKMATCFFEKCNYTGLCMVILIVIEGFLSCVFLRTDIKQILSGSNHIHYNWISFTNLTQLALSLINTFGCIPDPLPSGKLT